MKTSRALAVFLPLAACALAACNGILDFGSFHVVAVVFDGGAGRTDAGDASHHDATARTDARSVDAADARPADAGQEAHCPTPTDRASLERACTTAQCVPFDESRVPTVEGGLRPLPTPGGDAGSPRDAAVDGAPHDGAVHDAAARDAGPDAPTYPSCAAQPDVVYATGSSALAVLLAAVAQALAGTMTFVYQTTSSCVGVQSLLDDAYVMTGTAVYYDSMGAAHTCALAPAGVAADIGIADVFAETCDSLPNGLPATLAENFGPVQVMTFAVPASSMQQSISLAAAYQVYGFGDRSGVAPWTDVSYIFQRSATSGTQNMIAATIGVPATQWQGVMEASTESMLDALLAAGKEPAPVPDETLGILVSGTADANRATLRVLAFEDEDQACGYLPDSTPTAFDKYNVRNGHYPIWGPSHFYNRVNGGIPRNPLAQTFIDDLSGITPLPGVDLLALYAENRVIPQCAMHVQRSSDGSNYAPYTPPTACDCYYDAQAVGQTSCTACSGPSDCPASAPACNKFNSLPTGYCEPG